MWEVELPLFGRCPDCGADLGGHVRLWATPDWIARYQREDRLRSGMDRSVERYVMERHTRACQAAPRRRQRQAFALTNAQ